MSIKKFTKEQINNLKGDDLERFVIAYGDGQGDSYIKTLAYNEDDEDDYEDRDSSDPRTNMDFLMSFYDNYGGNMVNIRWIENNKLVKVSII